ncbi:unnamed protein product [Caenorhabditis angaria]|uniref:Integrin alpha-2 domain-containing protein n=1 Tax=Caenorhabditis angaria TaxID=860376 RepID=A0A9P1IGI8_9PELO|nr:unnamed protein product [Caenorhabditis angaria]
MLVIRPRLIGLTLVAICLFVHQIDAFNIDTKNAVVHHMPNSYFGYSLDFYHEQKGQPILVVGAPSGGSSNPKLAGIQKPGAVYSCPVNRAGCREVMVDQKGIDRRLNGSVSVPIDDKSHQFFGATIRSNDKHDKLVMCAPQYKYFYNKFELIEPVGNCFYTENAIDRAEEFSSCKQEPARHGRHRLGYGQCGFSAAIPGKKNIDKVFVAAPGVWYWQGAIFSQSTKNYTHDRPNTEYSSKEYDHDMLGYATATGDFDGDGLDDVVAGVPRGNKLHGKLSIYTSKLQLILNLTSNDPQHGEYCGGSVAVADVNKDGRDDIIMGCPFYTDYVTVKDAKTQERKPQYDVGRVIVFIQTAAGVFGKQISIVGDDQWGRFGFSLASAGDLNLDGFNDIVVGAPYAGKDKHGAVYIIHGSKDGVREKPTQKIEGSAIGNGKTKTFGFSVAGGVDVDKNGMPDIAVGAWKSGEAMVLVTKPVVTVTGTTEIKPSLMNLEEKDCDVDAKLGKQTCRHIKTCLRYDGKGDTANELEFDLRINLDDHSPEPRAYFIRNDVERDRAIKVATGSKTRDHPSSIEHRVKLHKNKQNCFSHRFFASSTMRDKLSPIHYSINYTMVESRTGRIRGDKLEPAIDTTVPLSFEGKVNIANNCGKDDLCVPDLKVQANADREKFLLGTGDNTMQINVTVQNGGEDSYETKLYFDVPQGFEYSGIETTTLAGAQKAQGTTAPSCSPTTTEPDEDGKWTFGCDLGNPLPANQIVSSVVRITASTDKPPLEAIQINAYVNSSNSEEASTLSDNKINFKVPVEIRNSLNLNGNSRPDQIDFLTKRNHSKTEYFDDTEIGPVVSHIFELRNDGPSVIDSATLDIFWPSFSVDNRPLLYIITEPYIDKPQKAKCRVKQPQNVNPDNLRISNTHIPTEEPRASVPYAKEFPDDESYENSAERTSTEQTSNFEYVTNAPIRPEYEYIEDPKQYDDEDEEFEDDEYKKKVKRATGKSGARREGKQRKATFDDLRDAVQRSKESGGVTDYIGAVSRANVDCTRLRCTHIECDITDLNESENVIVEIFSRLYVDTMIDEMNTGGDISSLAVAKVTSVKYDLPNKPTKITAVTTNVNAINVDGEGRDLPWWLYLIAVLIGLAILVLLILLLWRCGFFKRDRPPTEHAELQSQHQPDAKYADSSSRYTSQDQYNQRSHGQML